MENFFFFTDKQSWENQDQSNQREFGAIDDNKYRLQSTHKFSSGSQNFAIATCKSLVLIQEASGNPNLINIALKPVNPVDWEYDGIAYFIYRGIKKDSIIIPNPDTGTDFPEILASSPIAGAPDIKTAVIENKARLNTDTQNPDNDPAIPRHLGYSYSASADPASDDYVTDDVFLEEIFFKEPNDITFQLSIVEAGAILGEFSNTNLSGFEIIGDRIGFEATMGILRTSEEHVLDISSYNNLEKKYYREQVLNYFDAAAFYGNFSRMIGKTLFGFSATSSTFADELDIVETLQEFNNKNKIYIDIRHQTGYSYNYYNNFFYESLHTSPVVALSHHILGGFDSNPTNTGLPLYYTPHRWPIFSQSGPIPGQPNGRIPYYLSFLNLVGSLAAIYPTYNVATPYNTDSGVEWKNRSKGHIKERSILVYGKSLLDVYDDFPSDANYEGENFLKPMELLNYDDYINAGDDPVYIGKVKYDNTTVKILFENTDNGPISGYYNIKLFIDFIPSHPFKGIIPRKVINPVDPPIDSNLENSLLRYDNHILDLMFPIFEMKQVFPHESGRVSVRLYSSENAFITSGTYGYYYDQRYVPKVGVAEDDNNLTFFAYINEKDIYESARTNNEREITNLTSFTIPQQADFLFGLTKRDLNVTLQKQDVGTVNYKDLMFDINGNVTSYTSNPATPSLLFYLENNSINDGVDFELDFEYFDCITITKDQFEALKILKDTHFGANNKFRVYLGVRYSSLHDKQSANTIIGRYRLMLKGMIENSGALEEKHVITDIFIYTKITDDRKKSSSTYKTTF
ncbi:hypothetical protein KORDIASMS9_04513 [Kordia sp. SMS9]|uniref:hypothetical protein n=1 Tax=Kordia sp. SMS9 TaxID=2282170 RepID=UPI000E0D4138|nr:hypothetical protein [Kordia sp. SMS9]AXG72245.1 hypothetical protein KORDIASMS9_04513 [Kordia sp. SMS9]